MRAVFADKVAIVTGGGTGIGHAIARRLAREGASVVLAGRRPEPLEACAAEIRAAGGAAVPVPTDLGAPAQVERLVATAIERYGRVDHLVNNAILHFGGPLATIEPAEVRVMCDVGFTAPLVLTRLVLPAMLERGEGSIVFIGSTAFVGWPSAATYSAMKGGLDTFAQSLRRELAGTGVHIAAVHPGGTDTPSMTESARAAFEKMGFVIFPPQAVADAVVDAIVRRRRRVVIGRWEKRHVWLSRLNFPLVDRQLARMTRGFEEALLDHETPGGRRLPTIDK